ELLVVVAIIGILAAIAIPQFAQYRENAFNSAAESDLRNVKTSLESYYAENLGYPTD
ncbi:MAG TPA: pilus assembly protein, partial [Candidatus Cloacimonas sp.]|nr:pilus assembly protein [Candidatus Cloacimonas sp.]